MLDVTNLPSGQRSLSSTNNFELPSFKSLAPHGSGTHAPSISFFKSSVSISGLATGTTVTFPPLSMVLYPLSNKNFLKAISCVFPSWGEANFLAPRSFTDSIPESFLTTNTAPPLVDPAIILKASPLDTTYPFIAGLDPTYVTSILFANSASVADGPALKTNVSTFILGPNTF